MRRSTNRPPKRVSGGARRLGEPVPVDVTADSGGRPLSVAGSRVEGVRESWLVEDRWWTAAPIRRRYWEVVTEGGAVVVVYREPGGRWRSHR